MKSICSFLLCLLSLQALSQKDLRPGYIIQKKDTIHGLIQYREGKSSVQKCSFIRASAQPTETYSPREIEGFGFEARHFISLENDTAVVFAEVIVTGRSNLLRVDRIYYVQKDSIIVSLEPIEKEIANEGVNYLVEDKAYAQYLNIIFSDCENEELSTEIKRTKLTHSNIEKTFSRIVTSYNMCMNGSSKTYSIKSKKSTTFGAYVVASKNFSDVISADVDFRRADFKSSTQFTGGIFFNYADPRISEKFHMQIEASYAKASLDALVEFKSAYEIWRVEYSGIRFPFSFTYHLFTGNLSPYLRLGVVPTLLMAKKFSKETHYTITGTVMEGEPYQLRGSTFAIFGGTGVEKKIKGDRFLFVELRYNHKTDVLDNYGLHVFKVSSLDILAGIRI